MKNKIQQKIYTIFQTLKAYASKLRISSFVGGQFKERHIRKKENMTFMEWLECYQYLIAFIGVVSTVILTLPILYFTIKDINPNINSTVTITELPKIQNTLTGEQIIFEVKQRSNALTYIENPKVYIRVLYNFNKGLTCKDFDITDKLTKIQAEDYITLDKLGQIYEYKYQFGKSFTDYVQTNIDGDDVLTLKLYLKYYDKSNKKYRVTNRNLINSNLFKYKNNKLLDVSRLLDIIRKIENK
jgi:hypothetical protein